MQNTTYIGLSRMNALTRQLDIVANNLANMGTTAYKGERLMFQEYLVDVGRKTDAKQKQLAFVRDYGTIRNQREGTLDRTDNPLDVAITGTGYFAVDTPVGNRYTRLGRLRINNQGQLSDSNGNPLLNDRLERITIALQTTAINIAPDGTISDRTGAVLGKLSVFTFDNPQELTLAGNGLYAAPQGVQARPAVGVTLNQGFLEQSNVEPISEITNMMLVNRNFEYAKMIVDVDSQLQTDAIQRLAKVA